MPLPAQAPTPRPPAKPPGRPAVPGVVGAARPIQSGLMRAAPFASSKSSAFTFVTFAGRAGWSSGSSCSAAASRGGAVSVRPVQAMICFCCCSVNWWLAPSRASAKASVSAREASDMAERNFFKPKTRNTLLVSGMALLFGSNGILCSALVTAITDGSSCPLLAFSSASAAAFFICARAACSSESNSKIPGQSTVRSTRISSLTCAPTTISSWYSSCSCLTNASYITLAFSLAMALSSLGDNFCKPAMSDCCKTTKTSKPFSSTFVHHLLSKLPNSVHNFSFKTLDAIRWAFSTVSPDRTATNTTTPVPMRFSTRPSTSTLARATRCMRSFMLSVRNGGAQGGQTR
mmetsp:Transcript_92270/g.260699  ORF Transcript_92270/g.260699 Transcript_92270/m.260699 type:complete len:346 (+) Transcript_92270:359-1396(+)